MNHVVLACFAFSGLVGGFGAYQVTSFVNRHNSGPGARRIAAAVAVVACLAIWTGTSIGMARANGVTVLDLLKS